MCFFTLDGSHGRRRDILRRKVKPGNELFERACLAVGVVYADKLDRSGPFGGEQAANGFAEPSANAAVR